MEIRWPTKMAASITKEQEVLSTYPALPVETLGNEPPSLARQVAPQDSGGFLGHCQGSFIASHSTWQHDHQQHSGDHFVFLDLLVSTSWGLKLLEGTPAPPTPSIVSKNEYLYSLVYTLVSCELSWHQSALQSLSHFGTLRVPQYSPQVVANSPRWGVSAWEASR